MPIIEITGERNRKKVSLTEAKEHCQEHKVFKTGTLVLVYPAPKIGTKLSKLFILHFGGYW